MSLQPEQDDIPLILTTGRDSEPLTLGRRPEKIPVPQAPQKENYLISTPDVPVFVVSYPGSQDWRIEKQRIQDMIATLDPTGNSYEAAKPIYSMTTEKFAFPVTSDRISNLSRVQKQT